MKSFIKKIRYIIYNKLHGTRINSVNASLSASYGINVGIAYNTYVTSDVRR